MTLFLKQATHLVGVLVLCVAVCLPMLGCNSRGSAKSGPLSPRLVGKWECRKGFAGTITLHFKDDGSLEVSETRENKPSGYNGTWRLVEDKKEADGGNDSLLIQMQTKKGGSLEHRTIKFQDSKNFDLKNGAKIMGRFQKQ